MTNPNLPSDGYRGGPTNLSHTVTGSPVMVAANLTAGTWHAAAPAWVRVVTENSASVAWDGETDAGALTRRHHTADGSGFLYRRPRWTGRSAVWDDTTVGWRD